ncbi:hypothetical protein D3C81_2257930 [compost metagenome]
MRETVGCFEIVKLHNRLSPGNLRRDWDLQLRQNPIGSVIMNVSRELRPVDGKPPGGLL